MILSNEKIFFFILVFSRDYKVIYEMYFKFWKNFGWRS